MPAIPRELLNCVFYLYSSKEDADRGTNAGGTGFFLAMPTADNLGHHYGVTNWHVAVQGGFSCVRINTLNGPQVFEFGPEDWIFNPSKDDVAVVPLDIRTPGQIAMFLHSDLLLSPETAATHKIGPGDDVFMVGRFVDIDIRRANVPAVRFGNISTQPIPIQQPTKYMEGLSYCLDMHSRTGYSGSPVFVYRTPGSSLEWMIRGGPVTLDGAICTLLGIHWGQFSEELLIKRKEKKVVRSQSSIPDKLHDEYVEGMSGMTCVIPAWVIKDLLLNPTLVEHRERTEAARLKA